MHLTLKNIGNCLTKLMHLTSEDIGKTLAKMWFHVTLIDKNNLNKLHIIIIEISINKLSILTKFCPIQNIIPFHNKKNHRVLGVSYVILEKLHFILTHLSRDAVGSVPHGLKREHLVIHQTKKESLSFEKM